MASRINHFQVKFSLTEIHLGKQCSFNLGFCDPPSGAVSIKMNVLLYAPPLLLLMLKVILICLQLQLLKFFPELFVEIAQSATHIYRLWISVE